MLHRGCDVACLCQRLFMFICGHGKRFGLRKECDLVSIAARSGVVVTFFVCYLLNRAGRLRCDRIFLSVINFITECR
jgi:hypothetical protein